MVNPLLLKPNARVGEGGTSSLTTLISSLTTLTTLILEAITNYTDHVDFQYNIKNNSITDYVENSFITNYAGYADIQYYMKNNSISDCANYADFEYQVYFHHWLRWL